MLIVHLLTPVTYNFYSGYAVFSKIILHFHNQSHDKSLAIKETLLFLSP